MDACILERAVDTSQCSPKDIEPMIRTFKLVHNICEDSLCKVSWCVHMQHVCQA